MLRGYLVVEADGRRVPVGEALRVGRTRECGLILDDSSASRMHIEVKRRGDGFVWKDLGSSNGTIVNGARMLAGELKTGDRLQVGETLIRFEVEQAADEGDAEDTSLFNETILDLSGNEKKKPGPTKSLGLLRAVYTVMNEIATNYEPCHLMDRILETTVRAINAQRGAIFLRGEDGVGLLPCPDCGRVHRIREGRLAPAQPGELRVSTTVARRVLADGESVLYQDADSDGELEASESIVSLHLRSIVCVPLRAKHGILGILYFDSDREDQAYSNDDLLLASAVGNSAGLALENARMHREILEKQRIEQELSAAWSIQEGILFREWPSGDPRFTVYAEMHPAKTVGGDFYDFVQLGPSRIGLLVGDVSGKGMPAALTMARLLGDFRLHVREVESPAAVIERLNGHLVERSQRGMFCTLCYAVLDLGTGECVMANAGHPPALRIGASAVSRLPEPSGPPAGVLAGVRYADDRVVLDPGDTVLWYTDGIHEARSAGPAAPGEALPPDFGIEGIASAAALKHRAAPQELVKALLEEVEAFCAPKAPHDDCTAAALRYLGGRA